MRLISWKVNGLRACALVLVISLLSCTESKRTLAPELSNTIVNLQGDTVHMVAMVGRNFHYAIEADAEGIIQRKGKWERIGPNTFSGNIILWVCDEIVEMDESSLIVKVVFDGKNFNTGVPKREDYFISYEDGRIASVRSVTYEDGIETTSSDARFTWAHGNLVEIAREGTVTKYSYSKKKNPLKTFYTQYAFPIFGRSVLWGEFGYLGLGTENLPIVERTYQGSGDEAVDESQLINTKRINVELDETGLCRTLTYKNEGERAERVEYKYSE